MPAVSYRTVEFHRFGESADALKPRQPYIRTAGWDEVATEVSPTLGQRDVERFLKMLRYGRANASDMKAAQEALGGEASRFLTGVSPTGVEGLHQLDLLSNAGELWSFPFEAAFGLHAEWLKDVSSGVVITRRVRGGFSEQATAWPVVPRVLLLHAPIAKDLEQDFIDNHIKALADALAPWAKGKDVSDPNAELLRVRQVSSVRDIQGVCTEFKPAYVHVVGHGARYQPDEFDEEEWSLRLKAAGDADASALEIAEALYTPDEPPRVVTFAVCDSADQGMPIYAKRSIVQELHRLGVPVVIGSQLPLTKDGSLAFARAFYRPLFQGDDVRCALHAGRVAVRAREEAFHDWLSLVAYVRLPPEGYAAYLEGVGLEVELRLLDAAQASADELNKSGGDLQMFDETERLVRDRLQTLSNRRMTSSRKELANERSGLEASAYKRLAELLFLRGLKHSAQAGTDWPASRQALQLSLDAYRGVYETGLGNHWHGMQQMTLEAALTGRITRVGDWSIVMRAAELDRDLAVRTKAPEYWAYGTLCELALLGPRVGGVRDLDRAKANAALLVASARKANKPFAIESTHRQINRYVWWWTNEHGFFPGVSDLSQDARELLEVLA
jgi:hypothetical protein